MRRAPALAFTSFAAAAAVLSVAYLIGFLADLPFLPRTVDQPAGSAPEAIGIDLALVALFGLQHSLMAREGVKSVVRRLVSPALERAVYLLATCAALILLFLFWQPFGPALWHVAGEAARITLWSLFASGWLLGAVCLLLMSVPELFGFRQALRPERAADIPSRLRTPCFYRRVRHPLYLAFLIVFWTTPDMTAGHALLAGTMTVYILIGVRLEERDLVRRFGSAYRDYRRRAGMLLPRLSRRRGRP